MKFTLKDLDWAVEAGVIPQETCDALVDALDKRYEDRPSLTLANVMYYLGGLIVIGAMSFYVTTVWNEIGGAGHLFVALLYAAIFLALGRWLRKKRGLVIPGGVLVTAAVCMTPLAVHSIQEMTGLWVWADPGHYKDFYHWIKGGWFFMELATIITGVIALRWYRFPFISMPVAFSLWFMSMDLTAVLFGPDLDWELRRVVSLWFGLGMIAVSFAVDRRTEKDYAFWGYLFGTIAFWGGLSTLNSDTELGKFIYCCINLGMMVVSVLLQRRVFIVFGALGVTYYIGHLAGDVFDTALMFTFALTAVGLLVIWLGVIYHRRRHDIEHWLLGILPDAVRRMLPQFRQ